MLYLTDQNIKPLTLNKIIRLTPPPFPLKVFQSHHPQQTDQAIPSCLWNLYARNQSNCTAWKTLKNKQRQSGENHWGDEKKKKKKRRKEKKIKIKKKKKDQNSQKTETNFFFFSGGQYNMVCKLSEKEKRFLRLENIKQLRYKNNEENKKVKQLRFLCQEVMVGRNETVSVRMAVRLSLSLCMCAWAECVFA